MNKVELYHWCLNGSEFFAHSIWIGLVAVAIYLLSIRTSPKIKPAQRVWWGIGLLFVIPCAAALLLVAGLPTIPISDAYQLVVPGEVVYWLFGIGCAGISGALLFLTLAMVRMERIARSARSLSFVERKRISKAQVKLNLNVAVPIKVTQKVEGPLLCGIWRPVILIPEAVIKKADAKCMESILAHEYAHYLRKDIWVNLVQTIVEFAYFFHLPAKWMSRQVRLEREKACDDLAVELMGGRSFTYAAALLELESRCKTPAMALAFGSESTSDRASRIAFGECRTELPYSKLLVAISMTILLLLVLTAVSVVKVESFTHVTYAPGDMPINHEPPSLVPRDSFTRVLNTEMNWDDKRLGDRAIPMLKSVPLIERDGIVYNLAIPEPQLFAEIPNAWLTQYPLDFLKRDLPRMDPDRDHFTVLEEYRAGTDPTDKSSHPDSVGLLSFTGQFHESYYIRYAARTDAKTVQMVRLPSKVYPGRKSFFMKEGDSSPAKRIKLSRINADSVVIEDLSAGSTKEIKKQEGADLRTYFAKFSLRSGEAFQVKLGTGFYIPGDDSKKWQLTKVTESSCTIESGSGEPVTLLLR